MGCAKVEISVDGCGKGQVLKVSGFQSFGVEVG
jgi:hypothetical protein